MILVIGGRGAGKRSFVTDVLGFSPEQFAENGRCCTAWRNWIPSRLWRPCWAGRWWSAGRWAAAWSQWTGGTGIGGEAVGRLCCALAREAEAVYRLQCGLAMRLK